MSKQPVELAKGVYWVGAVDAGVRDFHGYRTTHGTTYNAYLVVDEKIALIDTVKSEFVNDLIERTEHIVPLAELDYVIANHVEMDHSGSLPSILEKASDATLVCSKQGAAGLEKTYQKGWDSQVVSTGDSISLGKRELSFIEAPMLHWPDSMFTYLAQDKILFPNDAFGQHYASSSRFDDEVDAGELGYETKKYYANILWPFSKLVAAKLQELAKLDVEMIAPSHGVIWRSKIQEVVEMYDKWAQGEAKRKAVVVYDTMWNSTKLMAEKIGEGLSNLGVEAKVLRLRKNHRSDVVSELLDASSVIVGTPTLNNTMYPSVAEFLNYVGGLKPFAKKWHAFGSHGWAGGGVQAVEAEFERAGFDFEASQLKIQYVPTNQELEQCKLFGKKIGEEL